ncbi:hypothetical protein [Leifsonia sp. C5G2]|uniref:hypothetical protein n=1 Tax=Leifsonia sp. C5G2 TaxID=2735269 RepID=UPI001584C9C9|nr:hypothetical protein [Leifsonia sp. C5G2]NUU06903.1 hypothetical protein [Leifsonia sp. C5G2]
MKKPVLLGLVAAVALTTAVSTPASAALAARAITTTGATGTVVVDRSGVAEISVTDTRADGKSATATLLHRSGGARVTASKGLGTSTTTTVKLARGTMVQLRVCTVNLSVGWSTESGCQVSDTFLMP